MEGSCSTRFAPVGEEFERGFADPSCRLSFGYAMNWHGMGTLLNDRGQPLVDATYRALGYRTREPGAWIR